MNATGASRAVERGGLCGEHPGVWLVRVPGKGWLCPALLTPREKIMLGIPSEKSVRASREQGAQR